MGSINYKSAVQYLNIFKLNYFVLNTYNLNYFKFKKKNIVFTCITVILNDKHCYTKSLYVRPNPIQPLHK